MGRWVQSPLFDSSREQKAAASAGRRRRRVVNRIRVTRDAEVAQAWDESHRISSEVTWQLARALSKDRIEQLRRLVDGTAPATSPT